MVSIGHVSAINCELRERERRERKKETRGRERRDARERRKEARERKRGKEGRKEGGGIWLPSLNSKTAFN